jgi:DNA-binding NtrC family response regulator
MPKAHVLFVDDDDAIRFGVREYLEACDYRVSEAATSRSALEAFQAERPDAAVIDYALPDGDALQLLAALKEIHAETPVIVLTAHVSIDLAVQAIKSGAEHFLTKPLELSSLLVVLERALEHQRAHRQLASDRARHARHGATPFLGEAPAIQELARNARRVAASDAPVLILGETGSGKGVLARWLHDNSPRAREPYVDLNCAGLPRELIESELFGHEKGAFTGAGAARSGLIEAAHRGTMFLDEIGDMDLAVQPKLLKILEDRRFRRLGDVRERIVDVRFIAATHQDLAGLVEQKTFRSDLFYRINTVTLRVPSLRERGDDLSVLASHLLKQLQSDMAQRPRTLSPGAVEALRAYPWPGNVRELRNVLERAVLLGENPVINVRDLQLPTVRHAAQTTAGATLDAVELQHIERALSEEHGHVERAARRLGIARSSLYVKIKKHGLCTSEE